MDILQAIRGRYSLDIQLAVGGVQSWASESHFDSFPTDLSSIQFTHRNDRIVGVLISHESIGHTLVSVFVVNNVDFEYRTIGSE